MNNGGNHGILIFIEEFYEKRTAVSSLMAAVLVLIIDYATGRTIRFPIAYVLPIGMAAWRERKYLAYAMALLLPCSRAAFHIPWPESLSAPVIAVNAVITALALVLYAYLVHRIAWQTRSLKKKVNILEGILPVCASCKRIRTENGEYEQMEKYISEHSEASFSHGICPECAQRLYPEFLEDQ